MRELLGRRASDRARRPRARPLGPQFELQHRRLRGRRRSGLAGPRAVRRDPARAFDGRPDRGGGRDARQRGAARQPARRPTDERSWSRAVSDDARELPAAAGVRPRRDHGRGGGRDLSAAGRSPSSSCARAGSRPATTRRSKRRTSRSSARTSSTLWPAVPAPATLIYGAESPVVTAAGAAGGRRDEPGRHARRRRARRAHGAVGQPGRVPRCRALTRYHPAGGRSDDDGSVISGDEPRHAGAVRHRGGAVGRRALAGASARPTTSTPSWTPPSSSALTRSTSASRASDGSLDGDVGTWEVGETPLAGNRPRDRGAQAGRPRRRHRLPALLQGAARDPGGRREGPALHRAGRAPAPDVPDGRAARARRARRAAAQPRREPPLHQRARDRRRPTSSAPTPSSRSTGTPTRPGRWDHWPSGFLFTGGADDGVDGKVVIAPGDIIFPFKSYVQTPIELTIEQGRIQDIRGDGFDADLLKDYMASFDDPDAYGIAHIGWGMLETAQWSILATDRRGMGHARAVVLRERPLLDGPNGELGGPNDTLCHVDIPMRNCTLYLDDRADRRRRRRRRRRPQAARAEAHAMTPSHRADRPELQHDDRDRGPGDARAGSRTSRSRFTRAARSCTPSIRSRSPTWSRRASRCAGELADADVDVDRLRVPHRRDGTGPGRARGRRAGARRGRPRAPRARCPGREQRRGAGALAAGRSARDKVAIMTPYVPSLTGDDGGLPRALRHRGRGLGQPRRRGQPRGRPPRSRARWRTTSPRCELAGARRAWSRPRACRCRRSPPSPASRPAFGLPVVTAATATVYELLAALGISAGIPAAGRLLAGASPATPV